MKIGSDEHKQRFCRDFTASHVAFEPAELPWPDLDEARRYYEKVVEAFPQSDFAKKARSRSGVKASEKPPTAAAAVDSKPQSQ